jgi:hypothetical protein
MKESHREKIFDFVVPRLDPCMMSVKALDEYNYRHNTSLVLDTIPEQQLHHIMVNFIRHRLIEDYNKNYGSPSFEKDQGLYFKWFKAINHEIGQVYPFLRQTVAMQISHKAKNNFYSKESGVVCLDGERKKKNRHLWCPCLQSL